MGVLAEALMFFLPERTLSLPWAGKLLAGAFLLFVAAFALTQQPAMASIVSADQAAAADRQTEGVRTADHALEAARASGTRLAVGARQDGCLPVVSGRGHQAGDETDPGPNKVVAQAKPESTTSPSWWHGSATAP